MRFKVSLPSLLSLGHARGTYQFFQHSGRRRVKLLRALAAFSIAVLTGFSGLQAQTCPAYGADKDCGTIITVTDTGATPSSTGQGPYDGNDDTLVGVINMSSQPIYALGLKSLNDIFGFDGDGVDIYGAPGNAMDRTGYGGPNAYFSNYTSTTGVVNFITPIPPGGKSYFSLENAISNAYSCQDVVNNGALTMPPKGPTGGANVDGTFKPNFGFSLQQAAQFCGFVNFDWVQRITHSDDPSIFYARNLGGAFDPMITGPVNLTSSRTPYSDPPQGGGYTYSAAPDYSYPFYYDAKSGELLTHETGGYTLTFHDAPGDPCISGGAGAGTASCGGGTEPAGAYGGYTLHLAGVNTDGTATDLGMGIDYTSDYNGSAGGVNVKKTDHVADGNGTGGVTVTSVQLNTAYQYDGLAITTVNGKTPGSGGGGQSIYVADNWRLQKFTSAGVYTSEYTINGGNLFPFGPGGIAVDSQGDVFLTDVFNKNVSAFDPSGKLILTFGSYGSGNGQFSDGISGVAIDSSGNVLVVDKGNNRVESFSNTGVYLGQFGTRGHGNGQFVDPVAIAVDGGGHIFVADAFRVQEFTSTGVYMGQFALQTGGGFLFGPGGLSLDSKGDLFVTDTANKTVVEFDPTGNVLNTFGSYGSGAGMFLNGIGAVALNTGGDILIGDTGNNRVQDFNSAGVFQSQFGARGNGTGQFNGAVVVAVGP